MFTTFLNLLVVLNPLGSIPLFLALTKSYSKKERLQIIVCECICVFALMLSFFLFGKTILASVGITGKAIQATGGLMLLKVGFQMNFPQSNGLAGAFGLKPGQKPFLVPIAMPMLIGSGMITKLIELSGQAMSVGEVLTILVPLTIVSAVTLASGELFLKWLGEQGLNVLERIMGLLLIMMACEMLLNVLKTILEATSFHSV